MRLLILFFLVVWHQTEALAEEHSITIPSTNSGIARPVIDTSPTSEISNKVLSAVFEPEKGTLKITRRIKEDYIFYSCHSFNCSPETTDRVVMQIYGVKDGKLALIKTIEGKIIPAQEERIEWPE